MSRKRVQTLRRSVDAVLIGSETVLADNPALTQRDGKKQTAWRIVVDGRGRIPLTAQVLSDAHVGRTIVATTKDSPAGWRQACEDAGARVMVMRSNKGRVSLKALLRTCADMGMLHVLCEGGGQLTSALANKGLVDEYVLFYAPCLLGHPQSRRAFPLGSPTLKGAARLRILDQQRLGSDLMIRARPEVD